jgi:hypothetical protein
MYNTTYCPTPITALLTQVQPTLGYHTYAIHSHPSSGPPSSPGILNLDGHKTARARNVNICKTSVFPLRAFVKLVPETLLVATNLLLRLACNAQAAIVKIVAMGFTISVWKAIIKIKGMLLMYFAGFPATSMRAVEKMAWSMSRAVVIWPADRMQRLGP